MAHHSRGLLTVKGIRQIEGSRDRALNPAMAGLRALAALPKTMVADLAEADLGDRVVALLREREVPCN